MSPEPGWLQRSVARSVATLNLLPPGLRRSLGKPRKRVPRYCPACGEPDPHATETMSWCTRCRWEERR